MWDSINCFCAVGLPQKFQGKEEIKIDGVKNTKCEIASAKLQVIEMSNADVAGRTRVKFAIHEVYPDSIQTNENGINWQKKYTEANMSSVEGMSLKVHFQDDEKTTPMGHGYIGVENGEPRFESEIVGAFSSSNPKIEKVQTPKGEVEALTAWSTIDSIMYPQFTEYLKSEVDSGNTIDSSVEIIGKKKGQNIKYLNGYNEANRTPVSYTYAGQAILGIRPADQAAVLLEIAQANNQKKQLQDFTDLRAKLASLDIKKNNTTIVAEMQQNNNEGGNNHMDENMKTEFIDAIKATIVAELNNSEKVSAEKVELESKIAELNATIAELRTALGNVDHEKEMLENELKVKEEKEEMLVKAIAAAELANQGLALNSAIEKNGFTKEDLEMESVKELTDKFNEDPKSVEVNAIVDKIKAIKFDQKMQEEAEKYSDVVVEQNSLRGIANNGWESLFAPIEASNTKVEGTGDFFR